MSQGSGWPGQGAEIKMPQMPKLPTKGIVLGVLALVVAIFAWQTIYVVGPQEAAVVLRLGEYVGTNGPGVHFRVPLVHEIRVEPVERQLKEEFGFRTVVSGQRTVYSESNFDAVSLMLTGDLNVAEVEWIIQYKIVDPYKYLFKVRRARETLRDLSEAVMRSAVGDHSVDEVLTTGRAKVASDAKIMLQSLCDKYDTGLRIEQFILQDVNPPEPVQPSFNEVNQAIQEREQLVNEARAQYNKAVPRAEGEANQLIRRAEGYGLERVNNARGEANRFLALHEEYRKAPTVTRRRLYLETVERVVPRLGDKIIVDEKLEGMLPIMDMSGKGLPGKKSTAKGGAS